MAYQGWQLTETSGKLLGTSCVHQEVPLSRSDIIFAARTHTSISRFQALPPIPPYHTNQILASPGRYSTRVPLLLPQI